MSTTAAALLALGAGNPTGWTPEGGGGLPQAPMLDELASYAKSHCPDELTVGSYDIVDDVLVFSVDACVLPPWHTQPVKATWVTVHLARFIPPWVRPAAGIWAGREYVEVVEGQVRTRRFEPNIDFRAGFKWIDYHGVELLVPADVLPCGTGCFERPDLRFELTWNDVETTPDERRRYARELLHSTAPCDTACNAQTVDGNQRNLAWTEHGFLDIVTIGPKAFAAAGALMKQRRSQAQPR